MDSSACRTQIQLGPSGTISMAGAPLETAGAAGKAEFGGFASAGGGPSGAGAGADAGDGDRKSVV